MITINDNINICYKFIQSHSYLFAISLHCTLVIHPIYLLAGTLIKFRKRYEIFETKIIKSHQII